MQRNNGKKIIGVIGGRSITDELRIIAESTGELIAQKGYMLICGGMGGVMEAACRGAKNNNGITIGILPGKNKTESNKFIDIPIVTAMSHARNAIIVRSSDALIAIGGQYGTLSEIALAKAIEKPVLGIKTWDIEGVIPFDTPLDAINYLEKHI
ncbi:MAG: TIGR00725 family protein [bacterium]